MFRFDDSKAYRKFVLERDRAAETLHTLAQQRSADVMRASLASSLTVVKHSYPALVGRNQHQAVMSVQKELDRIWIFAAGEFGRILTRMRATTYTLARASETEAVAQVLKKPVMNHVTKEHVKKATSRDASAGGTVEARMILYTDRIKRRLINAIQSAALTRINLGDGKSAPLDQAEFLMRVYEAMPRPRVVEVPRRILKPKLMEAAKPWPDKGLEDASVDMIDNETWDAMLEDYMTEYVPKWRGPESVVDVPTTATRVRLGKATDAEVWYAWELERDLTQEFVQAVRDGQIDAANQAGITDFVWVAILDDKTCGTKRADAGPGEGGCCAWRDGLLVSEIEVQLQDKHADDECKTSTPPAHFNCRCTLAPATDNIPERPDDGAKEFEEWLNS